MWCRRRAICRKNNASRVSGFSLPELMVTIAVIALVLGIALVGFLRHRQDAEDARMQAELTSIYKAMQAYRYIYGRYPVNYGELSEFIAVPDFDRRYRINPNP